MKVRMYNVGFGDCFCLRDRKKSLLVDFGTNNSRIEGRPRREIFDVIISDLSTIKSKNLLLTHFHMDHLSGLLYMMKKKDISVDFGKIYLPDVFSKKEMSRTLVLLLLADLLKESGLPSRQVSLFALVDALLENKQNVELLSRGKLFENKYQALWPDTDVIRKETDEVYNRICEDGKFKEVMDVLLEFAEKLRLIVWSMTAEGNKPAETVEKETDLTADILHGAVRAMDGRVAYVIMGQKEIAEKDITYEDIHCISTILRDCDDIELGFTMYEEEENGWRCSFRSDGKWINVNELLKPFGGGGHISAAGLKYQTDNVEELKKQILDRVAEMKKKQ